MKKEIKTVSDNKKKPAKINIELSELSNTRTWSDFINNDSFMEFPGKDDYNKRLAFTLMQWADKPESLEMIDFMTERKMSPRTMYEWIAKYPELKYAWDYAKLIVASRRRKGALKKIYSETVAFRDMHVLDPAWLEINRYHAEQKQLDMDKQAHTFNITLGKPEVVTPQMLKDETDGIK